MTYEEKLAALNSIAECSILMRKPGDWYVSQSADIKSKSMLEGRYGNGKNPEDAINAHWAEMTELLKAHEYVVIDPYTGRRAIKWNGFMWKDIKEE